MLSTEEKEEAEMDRRARADIAILSLPPDKQAAARFAETNLREQYDLSNPPRPRIRATGL
jgi:hypothetical protein